MTRKYPKTVEVLSSGDQWRVVDDGSTASHHRKKARAVEKGKRLAKKGADGSKLKIQTSDGRWQDIREY